ncbi:MAG: hypothetical protein JW900_13050 [Anaerolineae bacterium]|nr:hypothetical protein [Anaerolineae bacterium]
MRVLLAWLGGFSWILYAACALGAIFYIAWAISLHRRIAISLTDFERDSLLVQAVRLWRIAATFVLIGVVLYAGQTWLLSLVVPEELDGLTPTRMVGLDTPTAAAPPTETPLAGILPTIVPTLALGSPPPAQATPTPTLTPTPPAPAPDYEVTARFADVAELLGYDLVSAEVAAGQPIGLTLYWRALDGASAQSYVVFTHLLPPDLSRIVAQHDSMPAGGANPTTNWMPGEVVIDYHELIFVEPNYAGEARVAIGFYVPGVGRVPVEGGGDYVLLPVTFNVVTP